MCKVRLDCEMFYQCLIYMDNCFLMLCITRRKILQLTTTGLPISARIFFKIDNRRFYLAVSVSFPDDNSEHAKIYRLLIGLKFGSELYLWEVSLRCHLLYRVSQV